MISAERLLNLQILDTIQPLYCRRRLFAFVTHIFMTIPDSIRILRINLLMLDIFVVWILSWSYFLLFDRRIKIVMCSLLINFLFLGCNVYDNIFVWTQVVKATLRHLWPARQEWYYGLTENQPHPLPVPKGIDLVTPQCCVNGRQ